MKKTFAILACSATSLMAATTTFTELNVSSTQGGIVYTAPATGSSMGTFTGSITELNESSKPQTAVSFTLNITRAMTVTQDTQLINFSTDNSADVGLYLTSTGITMSWEGVVWNDNRNSTYTYDDLMALGSMFVGESGEKYITLTLSKANTGGTEGGLMLYSQDSTTKILGHSGLGSGSTASVPNITLNTNYIEMAAITPGWAPSSSAVSLAQTLDTTARGELIPEPTTATLSLLALAGLVARRRRK